MEIKGRILEICSNEGAYSLILQEDAKKNVWNLENLEDSQPISIIINKSGKVIKKMTGIIKSDKGTKIIRDIQIDITSNPKIELTDNPEAYIGMHTTFEYEY